MQPLPPGSTIGILGAGQLGRMLAMAAAQLGFKSRIYSDVPGPASDVAISTTLGAYEDFDRIAAFAAETDVVTYEFENVPVAAAAAVEPGRRRRVPRGGPAPGVPRVPDAPGIPLPDRDPLTTRPTEKDMT